MRKSSSRQDTQSLRWKPRMKNAANRSRSTSSTGTMNVADQALSAMRQIDRGRTADGEVDASYAARLAGQFGGQESVGKTRARGPATARRPWKIAMLTAAPLLTGAVVLMNGGLWRPSQHTVAGKVWLDRRPLGEAELRFHPMHAAESPLTVVAADDGRFELASVSAGKYRVTVHPPAGSSVVTVASGYSKPETTPFQLFVSRDVASLQLYACKVLPKPRKVAWTPGID